MTITTPAEFRQIGVQEGKRVGEGHSSAHMMFDPEGGPEHIAYLEGVIAGLQSALRRQRDTLTLSIEREVEPKEIPYMVFGTGATSYPWWERLTWISVVDDEDFPVDIATSDWDLAEPNDVIIITSWDGEQQGGKKVTRLTFHEIADAVAKAWPGLADEAQRDMAEDLGLADAEAADVVLQFAVFGEAVYG